MSNGTQKVGAILGVQTRSVCEERIFVFFFTSYGYMGISHQLRPLAAF